MVSKKLFIGWIPYTLTNKDLKDLFSTHWEIVYARILKDKETGNSRGFGFVLFENTEDAINAKKALHKYEIGDRFIIVDFSDDEK